MKIIIEKISSVLNEKEIQPLDKSKEISGILKNESVEELLTKYLTYSNEVSSKGTSNQFCILLLGLLYRYLDCGTSISDFIKEKKLESMLYGGLIQLFQGKSDNFCLRMDLDHSWTCNKYEYIQRIDIDFYRSPKSILLEAVKILKNVDIEKFYQLLFNDHSYLISFAILSYKLEAEIPLEKVSKMMGTDDELRENIGFSLLVYKYGMISEDLKNGHESESKELFEKELKKINDNITELFEGISDQQKISLSVNYSLCERYIPKIIQDTLREGKLGHILAAELVESGKIRQITDLRKILKIISKNIIESVSDAASECLIKFIRENKINLKFERPEDISEILSMLLQNTKEKLYHFLCAEEKQLMASEFDRQIRYAIFLNDVRKKEVISLLLNCIQNSPEPPTFLSTAKEIITENHEALEELAK